MNPDNPLAPFRILVCLDGSDESLRALRFAGRMGGRLGADLDLLHIHKSDSGHATDGLQMRVVRENFQEWGLETPAVRYLKEGRDILLEMEEFAADWAENVVTRESGDGTGTHTIEQTNAKGRKISLNLRTADQIHGGILQHLEASHYDLAILGSAGRRRLIDKFTGVSPVAKTVAAQADCSVIVARNLEPDHGVMIGVNGSPTSDAMVEKAAGLFTVCSGTLSVLSVAGDATDEATARSCVDGAAEVLTGKGLMDPERIVVTGDPVKKIIDAGKSCSLIILSDVGQISLSRIFKDSVAYKVLENADNSVMILR